MRLIGLLATAAYAAVIVWLYVQQPQTMAQVTGGMQAEVGLYAVDQTSFDEGLEHFRADRFRAARAAFARADPARRDPTTQFYVAYSYYREGWGRVYSDDDLFRQGLEVVAHAERLDPRGRVRVDDPDLGMRTTDELRAELERGMERDVSDLNPLRVFRTRK